jgi:predicted MFS family arabinose efflux permease
MAIENEFIGKKADAASRYAWVVVIVTLLAGLAAPLNQFKVPPVMPVLMDQFHLDLTTAGLLMSIFAITGLVLALPAGLLLHRWGPRVIGLWALGTMLAGAVLGSLAEGIALLLLSRLIEGVGMGLIAVVGPAVITMWFPPKKRGLPMGIWVTWVPLGSLIIYNAAPLINDLFNWRMVWWSIAGATLLVLLVFLVFFREAPAGTGESAGAEGADKSHVTLWEALQQRDIWLLALVFACYNFVVIGVIATYYPTFLKTIQHVNLGEASFVTSIKMGITIILAPLVGWLNDRVASPKKIIMFSLAALMVWMIFPFNLSGWQVSALMVLLGVFAAGLATTSFASVPAVTGPGMPVGITIAVLMIGQNLGQLLGPVFFGGLVERYGWASAGYGMIGVLAAGLAAARSIRMK